ncbi:hypothetical protein CKM354_000758000 [Cercospora kikuchii]|uniref:D-isomer specific 2-hydroxyacid dehydrogenase NAD-binding domain-containing protein n=1 Tax=Cercospora kikuchii TaxID=84275 RepID=A0A9P3CJI4_9PEZI|nr:uncharacterized protein CKM354_000758000 [Cercospora kikuchii]GIZ44382.1 hypothetical protein CKM354_000758000 [Cercospora kikuchii]
MLDCYEYRRLLHLVLVRFQPQFTHQILYLPIESVAASQYKEIMIGLTIEAKDDRGLFSPDHSTHIRIKSSSQQQHRASLPPGYAKHHIVYLDSIHMPLAKFDFDHTIEVYHSTPANLVAERIRTATIVVSVLTPVGASDLDQAPTVRLIAALCSGCSWIDKPYCQRRGIDVVHVPHASIEAVGEHFLGLYFACRRRIPAVNQCVKDSQTWKTKKTLTKHFWNGGPPLSCKQETLGIIGYGRLGQRIEDLCRNIGFDKVLVAERKGAKTVRDGRLRFEQVLEQSTVIAVACSLTDEALGMIHEAELKRMRKDAIIVNIARGGIIDEAALATALKEGWIYGAALDVLQNEPAGPGSSLLLPETEHGEADVPNLVLTAHLAWFAGSTMQAMQECNRDGIAAFIEDRMTDPSIQSSVIVHNGRIWK